jgi:hypothetical protein
MVLSALLTFKMYSRFIYVHVSIRMQFSASRWGAKQRIIVVTTLLLLPLLLGRGGAHALASPLSRGANSLEVCVILLR